MNLFVCLCLSLCLYYAQTLLLLSMYIISILFSYKFNKLLTYLPLIYDVNYRCCH